MSIWKSYNAQLPQTQHTVCSFYSTQSKGRRPAKLKSGKDANCWHLTDKFDHLLSDNLTLDPHSFDLVGLPETLKHHLLCSLCNSILSSRSVSTQCGHDFCSHCLSGKFPDCLKRTQIPCPKCNEPVVFDTVVSHTGTGNAIFISGCLDDLIKIHPLTSPITFGRDMELLPHAKVSSDTISRHVQAEYSIPQLCISAHFFRGFPHKTKIFSETIRGIPLKFGGLLDKVKN